MTKEYCDICGVDVQGFSIKDFFGGREYKIVARRTSDELNDVRTMTLCRSCTACMTYFMRNKGELANRKTTMRLGNRIRFLLLRPLKDEKGGVKHED